MLWLCYRLAFFGQQSAIQFDLRDVGLNALPVLLLAVLLLGLTGRWLASALIIFGVCFLLHEINDRKLVLLGIPVISSDFRLIPSAWSHWDVLRLYVPVGSGRLLGGLAAAALLLGLLRFEPKALSGPARVTAGALALVVSVSMFFAGPVHTAYQARANSHQLWDPIKSYEDAGLISTLISGSDGMGAGVPKPDPAALDALRHETQVRNDIDADEKPDIIVLMSESFFLPSALSGVPECEFLADFCQLRERSDYGQLSVPTYGGLTLRTEFEFLTGVALAHLPSHEYPYYSLLSDSVPSLASQLAALGYSTAFMHPNKRTFWDRHKAMPLLGFERFTDITEFRERDRMGYYISDAALTTRLIQELEANDSGQPNFWFVISMENHGPWGKGRPFADPDRVAAIELPPGLPESAAQQWRDYIYHLENAESELMRLVDAIDAREEPTVLLFFGDHLPLLAQVYAALQPKHHERPEQVPTPYLLLSNRREFERSRADFPVWELPNYLLNQAGLCIDEFCQRAVQLAERRQRASGKALEDVEALQRALQLNQLQREVTVP